jgi:alkaline phosphatase
VALKTFVEQKVDAIIQLGDLIDAHETVPAEEKSLREVAALLHKTDIPSHFVMGNHCLALLSKQRFAELAGCRDSHYHFDVGPMRFIVLDANYTKDGAAYNAGNFKWTDCFISEPQLEWLGETLSASRGPTIVTTHQRLDPDRHHTVANHEAVRKVIAEAGGDRVKAVFQGHSHRNLRVELNEVPYIVLAGVIEGAGLENNAYGILQLHEDGTLQLKGFGKQADYAL